MDWTTTARGPILDLGAHQGSHELGANMRKMITSTCADCGKAIHDRRRLTECYSCGVRKHRARAAEPVRASNRAAVASFLRDALAALGDHRPTAQEVRAIIDTMKVTLGCAECGYAADARALEAAHVDSTTKYRTRLGKVVQPADMTKASASGFCRYSVPVIFGEYAKCDILCTRCHRERTFGERPSAPTLRPWTVTSRGPVDLCGDCGSVAVLVDGVVCTRCDDDRRMGQCGMCGYRRPLYAGLCDPCSYTL